MIEQSWKRLSKSLSTTSIVSDFFTAGSRGTNTGIGSAVCSNSEEALVIDEETVLIDPSKNIPLKLVSFSYDY